MIFLELCDRYLHNMHITHNQRVFDLYSVLCYVVQHNVCLVS